MFVNIAWICIKWRKSVVNLFHWFVYISGVKSLSQDVHVCVRVFFKLHFLTQVAVDEFPASKKDNEVFVHCFFPAKHHLS